MKVYVTDTRHDSYDIEKEILAECGCELVLANCASAQDIIDKCPDADGLLVDMAPVTAEVVASLKKCRVINRYGVGYDNVDVAACTQAGIWVTYVPDYCAYDVSDHALALLMSCLRSTAFRDSMIRKGAWNIQSDHSFRLVGKTLGVLGAGRIARALMKKVSGFEFRRILVYDPYVPQEVIEQAGGTKASFEEVCRESDFISLHMPVTPETTGIINKASLSLMKPGAILVNTGRGPLINDADLIEALENKTIAAAGLDTHCREPLAADSPYLRLDNVVLTDHTAYSTAESVVELKTKSARNVALALKGEQPIYCVNKI